MTARQLIAACLVLLGVGALVWCLRSTRTGHPQRRDSESHANVPENFVARAHESLRLGDLDSAVKLIETANEFPADASPAILFDLGTQLADEGGWQAAERCLQAAVDRAPENSNYRLRLATLEYLSGRYSMAMNHWLHLLRHGGLDLLSLPLLGNRELRWNQDDAVLDRAFESRVADPLVCLAIAHRAIGANDFELCEQMLRRARDAELQEVHLLWGEMLYEAGRTDEFSAWLVSMQDAPDDGVGLWVLRGHDCRERNEIAGALRCYWEAFKRDPNHYVATDLLGRMAQALGRDREASMFVARAGQLREYAAVCRSIHLADDVAERHLQSAADLSAKLGCSLESIGWCSVAHALYPTAEWPGVMADQLRREGDADAGRVSAAQDPRRNVDFAEFPLPTFDRDRDAFAQKPQVAATSTIRFEDVAAPAGIDFVFEDGADPNTPETLLFEFTGGGVAVLDYDLNGWPDLCFIQGGGPPEFGRPAASKVESVRRPADRLYANLGTGQFADVSELAGLTDATYGQGATVADFNSDGFPDLYVANIGLNCLFANNGDGTFTKQACPTFAEVENWTTSCVMADFNGDAMPDIYDVNHVVREGVHTRMCKSGDASVPCSRQHHLQAAQDRLLLSDGQGNFLDATETAGIVAQDGLGLGVVAADFGRTGRLDLFVANDARANFFFVNRGDSPDAALFDEQALVCGLAFSLRGRAQACMGVAADDANGDGLLDLFVTNFYADYNTLYCQLPESVFEDVTQSAGIQATSYHYLGFGAQFVDADLDGDADLIFTNGDVVDYSLADGTRSYRQRAQFLENDGQGRFREVAPSQLGEFFESEQVGRGLARLDWNRDGREDIAISHIGSPASLLSNTSSSAGHYVDVRLVATQSCRDATGAVVTVTTMDRRVTKQFTAGDGYLASNQKNRIIGLGDAARVEQLQITWPSGRTETHTDLPADRTFLFIEEAAKPYSISW